MPRFAPLAAPSRAAPSANPAPGPRDCNLDTALALDKRTLWPTHRIRGFLMSRRPVVPSTR
jgi:hypothetical protein